jgi:hypothetical protein
VIGKTFRLRTSLQNSALRIPDKPDDSCRALLVVQFLMAVFFKAEAINFSGDTGKVSSRNISV